MVLTLSLPLPCLLVSQWGLYPYLVHSGIWNKSIIRESKREINLNATMEKTGNYLKCQGAEPNLSVYNPWHLEKQSEIHDSLFKYKTLFLNSNTQLDTDKQST